MGPCGPHGCSTPSLQSPRVVASDPTSPLCAALSERGTWCAPRHLWGYVRRPLLTPLAEVVRQAILDRVVRVIWQ